MKLFKLPVVSTRPIVKTTLLAIPLLVFGEFVYPEVLDVTCLGDDLGNYDFPMNKTVIVTNKMQRLALPLQATLYDQSAGVVTPSALVFDDVYSPPVVQVLFVSDGASDSPCDDGDLSCLDPYDLDSMQLNEAYEGNVFVYKPDSQEWRFNLAVRDYTATGTYTVTMESGNSHGYVISETCAATFIREKVEK